MRTVEQVIAEGVPDALRRFMRESCGIAPAAFRPLAPTALPQPERRLLVHADDMTSTLAAFHGSPLHVEVLQRQRLDELYLREVFLRSATERLVEYGVIAIALDQFTAPQQEAIQAGRAPLGGLLHQHGIAFVSSPLGFFSVAAEELDDTPLPVASGVTCYGRFNRLAKSTGEPLAWILEILPPSSKDP
jgi:chorismate-pyruvate lyase